MASPVCWPGWGSSRASARWGRRATSPGYHVIVADGPSLRAFCAQVGVHGRRGETARELAKFLGADRATNADVDTVPLGVWGIVKAERVRAGLTERQFQAAIGTHYCGSTLYKSCPSRERLMRCADALGFGQAAGDRFERCLLGQDRERRTARTPARLRRDGQGNPQFRSKWDKSP